MAGGGPDCIVVGSGIVGSCCAWHLQSRGASVTLIDSELPGQSTSFGNAGCISDTSVFPFSYPGVIRKLPRWLLQEDGPVRIRWSQLPGMAPWLYRFWRAGSWPRVARIVAAQCALMEPVIADFDHILEGTASSGFRQAKGVILLYDSEEDFAGDAWKYQERERLGLDWRRLDEGALGAMEPQLRLGAGVALFEPSWQHIVDPGGLTARIADAALELGATWIRDRVTAISPAPSAVRLRTAAGRDLSADSVVLAAGVWSNQLLGPLGYRVPLAAKRGYHCMFSRPSVRLSYPVMSASRHVLLTPMRAGLRISGTAEFAALDSPPDYRRARALLTSARHFMPDLSGEGVSEWMGQRPMVADSLPVLGPLPDERRILCAFGHGHYGLTQGPTTGRLIAGLALGEAPGIDLTPFSVERF